MNRLDALKNKMYAVTTTDTDHAKKIVEAQTNTYKKQSLKKLMSVPDISDGSGMIYISILDFEGFLY